MDWEDFEYYFDYVNRLYEREETLRYEKIRDKTFSGKDIIRIFENHLTVEEQGFVNDYFQSKFTSIVNLISNRLADPPENGDSYAERLYQAKQLNHLTWLDLLSQTFNLLYELIDTVKDVMTGDLIAFKRVFYLYKRTIILVNNWYTLYEKVQNSFMGLKYINQNNPWWMI